MSARQFTGHKLKRNHSNASPRYIIAYHSETIDSPRSDGKNGTSHTFRCGVAISGRLCGGVMVGTTTTSFDNMADFWQFVKSKTGARHTTWIIAHNALHHMVVSGIAEQFVMSELNLDWPRSKRTKDETNSETDSPKGVAIIEGPPTIIAARMATTQGRLVIVDSLNWFTVPLSDLGPSLGYREVSRPTEGDTHLQWEGYCARQASIVYQTFVKLVGWVRDNDLGMFRYTGAAQAMAAYRHRFMPYSIYMHDNPYAKYLERQAYFGGRTEVFRMGQFSERVTQLDVNSLFPSVMQDGHFPALLHNTEKRLEYLPLLPAIDYSASVAEVDISTKEPYFPVKIGEQRIYPIGRFTTTLCGLELYAAKKWGLIRGVKSWCEYKLRPLFVDWVNSLWEMRQKYKAEGNTLYADFTKRLMNSLYGKFAQQSSEWVNRPGDKSALPWCRWTSGTARSQDYREFRSFGWQVQELVGKKELDSTFVAIPAFITSAARMRMNWLRKIAGQRNIYYQGIDSLLVNDVGLDNLNRHGEVQPNELGKLRIQFQTNTGDIWGCCQYQLGNKMILSSRSSRIVQDEGGRILQQKYTTKDDLFNGGILAAVQEEATPWHLSGAYGKGTVNSDGWISPIELNYGKTSSNAGVKSE